ncbi:2Fe-2S iron-sulfur cluster binding domain-containing protein [Anabaena sp. FACHB-1237]|uniref:2Fe-2S iron-sulfur cluster-binding protein n=1 Tax=Anabaena sp. FACHB-1237 TaxID=2692769 RepID=UPI0016805DE4|nr:2Fe-2S iron-sulfur cluster binding domain-containing protein [Anabaena sp. FACHB-1237]MBD2139089.1 2Fe-2S iron-sulfur cluster binding domain-containing protein [Anabaena sp. FACHB-1237]
MPTTYNVEIHHQGQTYNIQVKDDETILSVALAKGLDLPTSCGAGVCTTCAALVTKGFVSQEDGMGVSVELQQQGYALLCVAKPLSDLIIETEKEEIVYQKQFGKN